MPAVRLKSADLRTRASVSGGVQLPRAQPDVSYADRAVTAWLEAQVAAYEIEDVRAELDAVRERLERAVAWFAGHGEGDDQYERAYRLRGDVEAQAESLRITLRLRCLRCWTSCRDTFIALAYVVERAAWLTEYAPVVIADSPFGFWVALQGERPAPGAWPPAPGEAYVAGRVTQIEWWNREELAEQLAARGAAA